MAESTPLDGTADTIAAHLAPTSVPAPLSRRVVPAIYSSGSTARAWETSRADCEGADAVMLHDAPRADLAATAVDVLAHGHALWYGVGIDRWARDLRAGVRSMAQVAATAVRLAALARDHGAELVMWNGEAAWRRTPGTDDSDARVEGALAEALHSVADRVGIAQGWTSYDHPAWHDVGWVETCGPTAPTVLLSLQRYGAGPAGSALATPAALRARAERSAAQLAALVRRGQCRQDLADGGPGCRPYLQLHGIQPYATVGYALSQPGVCLWALPGRADDAGREALRVLIAASRAGLWLPVRDLQAQLGVPVDGALGPVTYRALRARLGLA